MHWLNVLVFSVSTVQLDTILYAVEILYSSEINGVGWNTQR